MFTQTNLKKESEYFSTRHDIANALLPPDELSSAPTIICNKKSSVTLDLMGSDTDSFVYSLRLSVDESHSLKKNEILFWRLMYRFIVQYELIDIHQLSTDHPLFKYNPEPERLSRLEIVKKKNFKVLGKFKSECSDPTKFLASVVMLRPKLYCLLSVTDDEKRRCKGISKEVVKGKSNSAYFFLKKIQ